MKKAIFPVAILFVIISGTLICCRKTTNTAYDTSNLKQLFSGLNSTPQSFLVAVGRDTAIQGVDSTVLHFYPNSFKDLNGNILNSGIVNVKLVEMYGLGIMALNRASTTSNGQLLQSGGQVNITATMNGKEVFANVYSIAYKQPGPSTTNMQLFYGNSNDADTATNWTMTDISKVGTTAQGTIMGDSLGYTIGVGYEFGMGYYTLFDSCTNFNLVNCDRIYNSSNAQKTQIAVVVPNSNFNPSNTQIFVLFPTLHSITMGDSRQRYDAANNTFIPGNDMSQFPVGLNYEIVAIANLNGSFYYCEVSGVTTMGMSVNAPLAPETQGDIIARLSAL